VLLEDAQWKTYEKGYPITLHRLGRLLADFSVRSRTARVVVDDDKVPRLYHLEDLKDAFQRYLPPEEAKNLSHPSQDNDSVDLGKNLESVKTPSVTDFQNDGSGRKQSDVTDVTDSGASGNANTESERF
jgi:hypothetical protein